MGLISVILAYNVTCLPQTFIENGQRLTACTGLFALYSRDQLTSTNGLIPYLDYPLEYFFTVFPVEVAINYLGFSTLKNPYSVIYFSNVLMALCAIAILPIFYKLGISLKRVAIFYVFTPVAILYGLSFDWLQALLLILSYYTLRSGKNLTSGFFFGLVSGIKFYPIVLLPLLIKHSTSKLKVALATIITFGSGLAFQIALSPTNFLKIFSYFSSYGIEGSWEGLIFPSKIIAYGNESQYYVGSASGKISLPQPYEIISLCLVLLFVVVVYRTKSLNLEEDLLLGFSIIYIFLWISAPQFSFTILALLPLVSRISLSKLNLLFFYGFVIFASNIWFFTLGYSAGTDASLYIQVLSEVFLGLLVAHAFLRRSSK